MNEMKGIIPDETNLDEKRKDDDLSRNKKTLCENMEKEKMVRLL